MIIVMEPYGHTKEVLGGVSLVFVYLRTLFLPQFKEETRSLNIYFPVPIIFILRLNKVFRLIAISQARILSASTSIRDIPLYPHYLG